MAFHLLLVEDDTLIRRSLSTRLRASGHRVWEADSVAAAKSTIRGEQFDVMLVDFRLPDGDGFEVMRELDPRHPGVPAIVLSAQATVEHAVESMKRGAFTYVQKPVEFERLQAHIERAVETSDLRVENRRLRRLTEPTVGIDSFVGASPRAALLREQVRRVAASPVRAVLIEGESGSGKGLVARAIHGESPRAAGPFVSITCSAMPEQLLESELFGHEPGAFTDARKRKIGLIEAAEGGTLFLDEIGDMQPPLQAKLLGVLEERRFRRVGGTRELEADVRVISATHRDLHTLVRLERFREDLLYRLRVVPILVPSLRDRKEDIPLLAEHFATVLAAGWGRATIRMSADAIEALTSRPWPGNVRELRNAVERAVILSASEELTADDFTEDADVPIAQPDGASASPILPEAGVKIEEWIDSFIEQALARTGGNQSAAGRLVGMSRDQIRYRLRRAKVPPC